MKITVINGPNLNRLGSREINIYGSETEGDLITMLKNHATANQVTIEYFQSNHEGEIIDFIHQSVDSEEAPCYFIVNLGAFTHYSVAILDALLGAAIPIIEVHISNIYKREKMRHHSLIAPIAIGQIAGLGLYGYKLAIDFCMQPTTLQ